MNAPAIATLQESLPLSPEPLYRLLLGRPITQVLVTACDLNLFDELVDRSLNSEEISHTLSLPSPACRILINTCVALGLLEKDSTGYRNSALADHYLVTESPFSLKGLVDHFKTNVFPSWDHLEGALREMRPQVSTQGEKANIFQATGAGGEATRRYIAATHSLGAADGLQLANHFDFSPYTSLLDVGGGSGALSLAVAAKYPHIHAVIWERPAVCGIADVYAQRAGLFDRVHAISGNALQDPLPVKADVILFSLFIHAFGLEACAPLLRRCYEALPPGGCVLIYEPVVNSDRTGPLNSLLTNLTLLVLTGKTVETTATDYRRWLEECGFERTFDQSNRSFRHLIGGFKPA